MELWSSVRTNLLRLDGVRAEATDGLKRINKLQHLVAHDEDTARDKEKFKKVRASLNQSIEEARIKAEQEHAMIETALEEVNQIIALKKQPDASQEKRKKRKIESVEPSPSPVAPQTFYPPAPPSSGGGGTPMVGSGRSQANMKIRRDRLTAEDQLPLHTGRPVAFRQPKKTGPHGQDVDDGEAEQWILAKVLVCINGDRNRYTVQDVEPSEEGGPGPTYNTTLRSLIPLPYPGATVESQRGYPPADYPIGTHVLGVYPDTTTLYRAMVVGQPPKGAPGGRLYQLRFEDDDAPFQTVYEEFVVALPQEFT